MPGQRSANPLRRSRRKLSRLCPTGSVHACKVCALCHAGPCRRHSERQGLGTLTSATGRSRSLRGRRLSVVERRSSGEHSFEVPDVVRDDRSVRGDCESQSALGIRLRAGGPVEASHHQLGRLIANDKQGLSVVQPLQASTDGCASAVRDVGVSHGVTRREPHTDACRGNALERLPLHAASFSSTGTRQQSSCTTPHERTQLRELPAPLVHRKNKLEAGPCSATWQSLVQRAQPRCTHRRPDRQPLGRRGWSAQPAASCCASAGAGTLSAVDVAAGAPEEEPPRFRRPLRQLISRLFAAKPLKHS